MLGKLFIFALVTIIFTESYASSSHGFDNDLEVRATKLKEDISCKYCAVEAARQKIIEDVKIAFFGLFNLFNKLERDCYGGKRYNNGELLSMIEDAKNAATVLINDAIDMKWNVITMLRPESSSAVERCKKIAAAAIDAGIEGIVHIIRLVTESNLRQIQSETDAFDAYAVSKLGIFISQYFIAMREGKSGRPQIIIEDEELEIENYSIITIRMAYSAIIARIRIFLAIMSTSNPPLEDGSYFAEPRVTELRAVTLVVSQMNNNFKAMRAFGGIPENSSISCDDLN